MFDSAVSGEYADTLAGKTHTFTQRSVRYVRDYLNGSTSNSGNHWTEIEVWRTATTAYVGDYFEWNGSPQTMTRYYSAGGARVAVRNSNGNGTNGLVYLFGDHLGSASVTADPVDGDKLSELRYKAWGETRHSLTNAPTDRRYTGQTSEEAGIGLYYYGARFYDPLLGRFASPDSIIPDPYNPLDWDRYSYVRNNPTYYSDPTGNKPCELVCPGDKINSDDLADSIRNDPEINRYWDGLAQEERDVLGNTGWDRGSFNDSMTTQTSSADFWHDPLSYLLMGVGGGRAANAFTRLFSASSTGSSISVGTTVYRVWGSDPSNLDLPGSGAWGHSWTPINPSSIENFRNIAGLPSGGESGVFNAARFVSVGKIIDTSGIVTRQALSLDGKTGGLLEYLIPDPQMQVLLKFIGGVNPPF